MPRATAMLGYTAIQRASKQQSLLPSVLPADNGSCGYVRARRASPATRRNQVEGSAALPGRARERSARDRFAQSKMGSQPRLARRRRTPGARFDVPKHSSTTEGVDCAPTSRSVVHWLTAARRRRPDALEGGTWGRRPTTPVRRRSYARSRWWRSAKADGCDGFSPSAGRPTSRRRSDRRRRHRPHAADGAGADAPRGPAGARRGGTADCRRLRGDPRARMARGGRRRWSYLPTDARAGRRPSPALLVYYSPALLRGCHDEPCAASQIWPRCYAAALTTVPDGRRRELQQPPSWSTS